MKRPLTLKSKGAAQLSLLPEVVFCPILPNSHSAAGLALDALIAHPSITQLDWLKWRHGWRLAAAIMELNYLGWDVQSRRVTHHSQRNPIAAYSLTGKAKRAATRLRKSRAS